MQRSAHSRPPRGGRGLKSSVEYVKKCRRNGSPPSRGAWIEIRIDTCMVSRFESRPPRGGRGLKFMRSASGGAVTESPPSRGAWIEIQAGEKNLVVFVVVAPLAGGVD